MRVYPKNHTQTTAVKTEKDITVARTLAIIFVFVSVFGIGFKLVFL